MRKLSCGLLALGCAAHAPAAPPAPATPAPTAVAVEVPPAEPALPAEPAGLVTLARPASVCDLKGPLGAGGVALGTAGGANPFAIVEAGDVALSIGEDGAAFVEIRLPTGAVLRGFQTRQFLGYVAERIQVALYSKRWFAFGGVYYPGVLPLRLESVKDGKVVVTPHLRPEQFVFASDNQLPAREVSCADLSLTQDPNGELRKQAPPVFLSSGRVQPMWLTGTKPVAVAAESDGPAVGNIPIDPDDPLQVVLLERKGPRARIRYERIAGWVDGARLSAKRPKPAEVAEFGMIGLLNGGGASESDTLDSGRAASGVRRVSCSADARLVVEVGTARFVVGTIPSGRAFVIAESSDDLAYLEPDGSAVSMGKDARLAVPLRDASGCAEANSGVPDALVKWNGVSDVRLNESDAVSALGDAPKRISAVDAEISADSIQPSEVFNVLGPKGNGPQKRPKLRMGAVTVSGRLPPEVIQRIVRQNYGRFRLCYEQGLQKNPTLDGRVAARFVIGPDGTVKSVANAGSSMPDPGVASCVLAGFYGLSFPQPEGGIVTVVYPIEFTAE